MFYLSNVESWLEEILSRCGERGLDPQASIFAIFLFSSLDIEYVNFFSRYRTQISAASGKNIHLFTPIVYNDNTIPDDEWRYLREHFRCGGIPLPRAPSVVLFKLKKRKTSTGFEPEYFAAHELPPRRYLPTLLRDFVDACVKYRNTIPTLCRDIHDILGSRNLITGRALNRNLFSEPHSEDIFLSPLVFISYSHQDSSIVEMIYNNLKISKTRLWLDKYELSSGCLIQKDVEQAIKESDALIVVLSAASVESAWIQFEGTLFYGRSPEKRIIPMVIDDMGLKMTRQLPFLQGRSVIDFRDPSRRQDAMRTLAESLRSL